MASDNGFSSGDDDDELLQELQSRPPRASQYVAAQLPPLRAQQDVPLPTQSQPTTTDTGLGRLQDQLMKAQGEASMLRDKLALLYAERKQDKKLYQAKQQETNELHSTELSRLKESLRAVQVENQFLALESKRLASSTARNKPQSSSNTTPDSTTFVNTSPISKRRKITTENTQDNAIITTQRNIIDDKATFFEFLISHTIAGADLTTIEILNRINLSQIHNFQNKNFYISNSEPIGEALVRFLVNCKKSLSLDKFIDVLLENLAVLIKEISFCKQESNLAVPFLIVLMNQAIIFRPSAVDRVALNDLFYFTCDLIKIYQHVLKKPLHEDTLELHVEPQIFQYELIDHLVTFNCFDMLEVIFRILQTQSPADHKDFLTADSLKLLEQIYKLVLTISYKPIVKVIYNVVGILNVLSSILLTSAKGNQLVNAKWWRDCITRLYNILQKDIKNINIFQDDNDPNCFYMSKFHDLYGTVRNIGTNAIGSYITQLIYKDKLQSLPKVISKDCLPEPPNDYNTNTQLERWFLELKDDVLVIIENLLIVYPPDMDSTEVIINGEMLIQVTRLLAKEQELMITRYMGQDSMNLSFRCHIIEHALSIVYKLWTVHKQNIGQSQIKEVESELVMSLWRFLAGNGPTRKMSGAALEEETLQHELVDKMYELELNDCVGLYDDALEDMPDYMEEELARDSAARCPRILQLNYGEIYKDMARSILESGTDLLTSIEEADSLYLAMST